MIYRILIQEST